MHGLQAPMIVANGSTDVTTYFFLTDSTNHVLKSDATITDLDLYYQLPVAAQSAKVDATALAAADSAHADNKAYHCGNACYRIDWPDTCFDGGVGTEVTLIVVCSGVDTAFMHVTLSPRVNVNSISNDAITAASINTDALTDDAVADSFFAALDDSADVATACWAAATRTLTALDEDSTTIDIDTSVAAAGAALALAFLNQGLATSDADAENARTVRSALRLLRNKSTVSSGTMTVCKEDDSATAWTATATGTPGADPITTIDPA